MTNIKIRAWHAPLKRMFTAEEMSYDQMALLPNGYFANIHSASTRLSVIYPHETMLPLLWTGLLDKNGAEVYDGDIVRLKFRDGIERYSYELGVVKWSEKSAAFKWFAIDEDPSDENNYWLTHADADWREVVGNIYENAELLMK